MNRVILTIMTLIWSLMSCATTTGEKQNEEYSDTWLKAKIVTTYALNEHLNPFTIDVDVENGVSH